MSEKFVENCDTMQGNHTEQHRLEAVGRAPRQEMRETARLLLPSNLSSVHSTPSLFHQPSVPLPYARHCGSMRRRKACWGSGSRLDGTYQKGGARQRREGGLVGEEEGGREQSKAGV